MLYSNINLTAFNLVDKVLAFSPDIDGFGMPLIIYTDEVREIKQGMNKALTIKMSTFSNPCVKRRSKDKHIYLILSTFNKNIEKEHLEKTFGCIQILRHQKKDFKVISLGDVIYESINGKPAENAKSKSYLLKVTPKEPMIVRIKKPSTSSKNTEEFLYLITKDDVIETSIENIESLCDDLKIAVPFKIVILRNGKLGYSKWQWYNL